MDFHCHLDLYQDARKIYRESRQTGDFVWLVTTSPRAFVATSRVFPATANIYITPGLHPEVADQKFGELERLLSLMKSYTGVGEIGLDGSPCYRRIFDLQKHIFRSVVETSAKLGGRVLSVHSRAAANVVVDILDDNPGFGTAVLHWFTDSPLSLQRAIESGCWFSVGPVMLQSANGRRLVEMMPIDRVIPESDGPFARKNGIPVMPWEARQVSSNLAKIWGVSTAEASMALKANGMRLIALLREDSNRSCRNKL